MAVHPPDPTQDSPSTLRALALRRSVFRILIQQAPYNEQENAGNNREVGDVEYPGPQPPDADVHEIDDHVASKDTVGQIA